ncbi:MAG: hypothetical protein AAGA03_01120 [Planctomycetota bacterium]
MQLDQTHVVIRLRSLVEIGDLALVMIRSYPAALGYGFVIGMLPWAIVNALILSWIPITELEYGFSDDEAAWELTRYLTWMPFLVFCQTPIAGLLTTAFLGQAVFDSETRWSGVWSDVRRHFWRCTWSLGVLRMPIAATVVCAVGWFQPVNAFRDAVLLLVLLMIVSIQRSSRPFLPEILLLEQCPLKSKAGAAGLTASRRTTALHTPMSGDLLGRFLVVSLVMTLLMLSFYWSLIFFRGIALGNWNHDVLALTVFYPLALWAVAGISVVVRFLSYLDTRIRLEGWEVELAIRAEAIRQFGTDITLETHANQVVATEESTIDGAVSQPPLVGVSRTTTPPDTSAVVSTGSQS